VWKRVYFENMPIPNYERVARSALLKKKPSNEFMTVSPESQNRRPTSPCMVSKLIPKSIAAALYDLDVG
jgi:hypothetical protein